MGKPVLTPGGVQTCDPPGLRVGGAHPADASQLIVLGEPKTIFQLFPVPPALHKETVEMGGRSGLAPAKPILLGMELRVVVPNHGPPAKRQVNEGPAEDIHQVIQCVKPDYIPMGDGEQGDPHVAELALQARNADGKHIQGLGPIKIEGHAVAPNG